MITNLIVYKDGRYLVFEFEGGKDVRYDLSNGCMIGKRGKPVSGLGNQLAGYQIQQVIDSFPDEKYKMFLNFVYKNDRDYYWNVGTFLKKIKRYSRFEQFFSAGITNVSVSCKYTISDIPRGLIRLSQECDFQLTNNVVEQYRIHKDIVRNIFEMDFITITKVDLYNIVLGEDRYGCHRHFNELLINHKYHYVALLRYIDNLMTYEALDRFHDAIRELNDYVNMMSKLSPKFEKYPKNFLTTHKIAARNYNRLKQEFPEELFEKIRDEKMECIVDEYKFIYPQTTQCIKDEAVQQQNCLASYIQKVIDGDCHILFMRKKDKSNEALITLEIRGMQVVQSKGKFNRDLDEQEKQAVSKYNERLLRVMK